jgi:hypothetical protein
VEVRPAEQRAHEPATMAMPRPLGVTLLAYLQLLLSLSHLAGVVLIIMNHSPSKWRLVGFLLGNSLFGFLLYLSVGVGFLYGRNWARLLYLICGLAAVLITVTAVDRLLGMLQLVFYGAVAFYLTRSSVRSFFTQ